MAKSSKSKSVTKKKSVAKKVAAKSRLAKKNNAAKSKSATKSKAKKPVVKKVATKNKTAKKVVAKKKVVKKAISKKTVSKKPVTKKVSGKKPITKSPKIKIEKIKEAVPSSPVLNDQAPTADEYIGMIDANIGMPESKSTDEDKDNNQLSLFANSFPAPEEKYARALDPYHGHKETRKGKRNIVTSAKKPLWKK